MKNTIEIIEINYFRELDNTDWNKKVVYRKNGKCYVACFYDDTFNKRLYYPNTQQKGHKVLKGLHEKMISDLQKRGFNY